MAALNRLARLLRGVSALIEHPDLLPLQLRGVPPRLALSLDHVWLRQLNVRTVIDVGANAGQFALAARRAFPEAVIHSFEPLVSCFEQLQVKTSRVPNIHLWNMALGEAAGPMWLEQNEYSPSSSILALTEQHRSAFPFARKTEKIKVNMERLDAVFESLDISDSILIKIDVQGYEDRVLRGGFGTVGRARVLIIETSFERLYQGQVSHAEICHILEPLGFEYRGALDQLSDPTTGRILSADSVFLRSQTT